MSGAFEQLSGAKAIRVQGESQKNIANFNAEVAEKQAEAERARAEFAQTRQAKEAVRIKSATAAAIGAAGGSGSPVSFEITGEEAKELELENLLIGFEGEVKSGQLEQQAILDRLQGKLAKASAKAKARQANIQFALQLASFAPFLGGSGGSQAGTPVPVGGTGGGGFNASNFGGFGTGNLAF